MVGFNAQGLIYLRLPLCTLHTHPSLSDCIVRVLCVSLQLKVLKEMKTDYSGTWAVCLFFFNKGQEGNRKLSISVSWQAIHWSCRILMGIVGKEKRVYFDTSGSLSCLWSTAICYGFVPQAIVCFVNRTDVEITKCLFPECGWIRSRWCYLDFYFVLWQWVKAKPQCSCGEEQCWVQSRYSISAPESAR